MKDFIEIIVSSPMKVVGLPLILILLLHERSRRMFEAWYARLSLMLINPINPSCERTPTVSGLFVYPVKSLRAVEIERAENDDYGFVQDRRIMLVCPSSSSEYESLRDDHTHRFLTQRQCPQLATVAARYLSPSILVISCEKRSITVNIQINAYRQTVYCARLWENIVKVVDLGEEAALFFQDIVGNNFQGVRLTKICSDLRTDDRYLPPEARTMWGTAPKVALTDGFPILIACAASLEEVNKRLKEKGKDSIPMSRFRPNIVIHNTKPFEEDNWKTLQIGGLILHVLKGCPRCKQSCTDQKTGKVSNEPLSTLADFRAVGGDVYFAQNAVAYGKSISKGDSVRVLKKGAPVWDEGDVMPE